MNSSHLEEKHLLKRIANDDREALDKLFDLYMVKLYNFVHLLCKSKDTTEEVIQDLFVKIWVNREKLEQIPHFKVYVFRTAQHLLIDRKRKLRIEIEGAEKMRLLRMNSDEQANRALICEQFKQLTMGAISLLPEKRQRIVTLRTQEERSPADIADQLDIPKIVVKRKLAKGLIFIRDYIHQLNDGFA